jgi:hypothetical protein
LGFRRRSGWGAPHPDFSGEEFARQRPEDGNKSTVNQPAGDGGVAIFGAASTPRQDGAIFLASAWRNGCFARAEGTGTMRQLNSFLRAAPSRIGRRLAQIVAIAAASLPAAGA